MQLLEVIISCDKQLLYVYNHCIIYRMIKRQSYDRVYVKGIRLDNQNKVSIACIHTQSSRTMHTLGTDESRHACTRPNIASPINGINMPTNCRTPHVQSLHVYEARKIWQFMNHTPQVRKQLLRRTRDLMCKINPTYNANNVDRIIFSQFIESGLHEGNTTGLSKQCLDCKYI